MQQRSAKSMTKVDGSLQDMNSEYKNLELLGEHITQNKVEALTSITNEWERKRLQAAILPSTVEKMKYDSSNYQGRENDESEVQKQFFRKLLDVIDDNGIVQHHSKPEGKLISKKKGNFEKMKKFLRLSTDNIPKEKVLIKDKQSKESSSPFKFKCESNMRSREQNGAVNKIDLLTEFAQTPKKNGRPSEDKAPLLRKLSNAPLPLEQVYSKEKLLSRDEAEITAPAKTPTKKPWYKFW